MNSAMSQHCTTLANECRMTAASHFCKFNVSMFQKMLSNLPKRHFLASLTTCGFGCLLTFEFSVLRRRHVPNIRLIFLWASCVRAFDSVFEHHVLSIRLNILSVLLFEHILSSVYLDIKRTFDSYISGHHIVRTFDSGTLYLVIVSMI